MALICELPSLNYFEVVVPIFARVYGCHCLLIRLVKLKGRQPRILAEARFAAIPVLCLKSRISITTYNLLGAMVK